MERTEYRAAMRPRKAPYIIGGLIAGLLLGLLLGGMIGRLLGANDNGKDRAQQSSTVTTASTQDEDDEEAMAAAVAYRTQLQQHAQLLIETARETVDAPSDEARAARAALNDSTESLARELADNRQLSGDRQVGQEEIQNRLTVLNESFLTYAETSDADEQPVTQAVSTFNSFISDTFELNLPDEFTAQMISFRNSALESIRSFRENDYESTYDKQLTAQQEFTDALAHVKARD